ncbi:T9SS type A sorting domain-containing protein [Flavobacterium sp.]|uniref:T9SS type A sorting domain-containing protein n=1 Tax=Flavobacterium sp. TaxID=239 RepID=UPI00262E58D5|nr:T9SS type A sorting domain-containing protein [Flavobacterium sp.]
MNVKNGVTTDFINHFDGCNNLNYICVDDDEFQSIQNIIQNDNLSNVQVNTYCSFVPGGNYNTITGTLTLDNDNNGCDVNDYHFPNSKIKIGDVSALFGATFTSSTGNYNFYTQTGDFQITPEFENPYFTVSPPSATITFADANNNVQTQNFCISPIGVHNDIEVSILPIRQARPGFDAHYQLVYKNKGNQTLSGNVNVAFDDTVLDFVSSNPTLTNQTPNNLNWNYSNLLPFESRTINFTLNVNSPIETPAVNIGDILNFAASIDPIVGDETVADNTFPLLQTVVGSFDPNDKTCLEGNAITPEMVGGYLHYLIRFQNSGTAAAENIVVKDVIDATKFDISSLQLTSSSHPQVTKITGNKVEFQFGNINLPAEINDEPGSHGYVAFKIKTKGNLVIGNSVANKADIYFDYNFPIETNTATSTVALLGLNTFENTSVNVTPNPTKNIVHITSKGNITSVQLFDVQGRILETLTANAEQLDFDLSQKTTGVYFVKIITEKGTKTEKIIKE